MLRKVRTREEIDLLLGIKGCYEWVTHFVGKEVELDERLRYHYDRGYYSFNEHMLEPINLKQALRPPDMKNSPFDDEFSVNGKISVLLDNFKDFLIEKNNRYGDIFEKVNVFSKSEEDIEVRLDDKIKRIMNSDELRKNDVSDMLGYTVFLMIKNDWLTFQEMLD